MDDVFGVEVVNAFDDFVDELVDEFGVQAMFELFDEIEQIAFKVLEYEIDLALLLEGLLDAHHVVALQHLQHLDFPW